MVTLYDLDLSDDESRLLEAFNVLRPEARDAVLQRVCVSACCAVMARDGATADGQESKSPEQRTRDFLMRCMPGIPTGYVDDFGFEYRYRDHAVPRIEWRCISLVLGSTSQDAANAAELAEVLTECATSIASDFCAPDFEEEGFIDVETVRRFIDKWRENFAAYLARAASRPSPG